jgi:hypothetical protein
VHSHVNKLNHIFACRGPTLGFRYVGARVQDSLLAKSTVPKAGAGAGCNPPMTLGTLDFHGAGSSALWKLDSTERSQSEILSRTNYLISRQCKDSLSHRNN